MSEFKCQFCNKNFSTKYNLLNHQKTTKRCLAIQNANISEVSIKCDYCDYKTTVKANLDRHTITCSEKKVNMEKDKIIDKLKMEIISLNTKLEVLTSKLEDREQTISDLKSIMEKTRPIINNTNSTNYIIQQQRIQYSKDTLHPYEELKKNIPKIIATKFKRANFKSIVKVATFITHDILGYDDKIFYQCYNTKNPVFHKMEGNEIKYDKKAGKLLNYIIPLIINRCQVIYNKYIEGDRDEKSISDIWNDFQMVKEIMRIGSAERKICIGKITECYNVSREELKLDSSMIDIVKNEEINNSEDIVEVNSDDEQCSDNDIVEINNDNDQCSDEDD